MPLSMVMKKVLLFITLFCSSSLMASEQDKYLQSIFDKVDIHFREMVDVLDSYATQMSAMPDTVSPEQLKAAMTPQNGIKPDFIEHYTAISDEVSSTITELATSSLIADREVCDQKRLSFQKQSLPEILKWKKHWENQPYNSSAEKIDFVNQANLFLIKDYLPLINQFNAVVSACLLPPLMTR